MAQTVSEKIISAHAGKRVAAGEIAVVSVDGAMATDATAPFAIKAFEEMGGDRLWDPERVSLILDHATPAPNEQVGNLHRLMRQFQRRVGGHFYEIGEGICHQLMVEDVRVRPGDLFVGADSHTPTYGALNAFAVGVGSTELAAVWLTGKIWLKVPETIRVDLQGQLRAGLSAKDIILAIVGKISLAGATYNAIEFCGEAVSRLSLASRMTIANMSSEMGAKTGLVDPTGLQLPYEFSPIYADDGANYKQVYRFEVSNLRPQVAVPNSPDNVQPIDAVKGRRVDQAFIGSCTNARLEDLHVAAKILAGKQLAAHVRMIVAPASRRVLNAALRDGTAATLSEAGVTFITSGCGPCVGTHQGIPGDGDVVISSTNRNFRGRMGNPHAEIYLGSPALVAASALRGELTDPADVLDDNEWDIL